MIRTFLRPFIGIAFVALAAGGIAGCGRSDEPREGKTVSAVNPPIRHQAATETCCAGIVYTTRATGYYPASNRLQGGYVDRRGKKLRTLQDFIDGRVTYVSVAMDPNAFPYGKDLCIPELNAKYGKAIKFKVVDTGGAFKQKGTTRIDICNRSKKDTHDKSVNKRLEFVACDAN